MPLAQLVSGTLLSWSFGPAEGFAAASASEKKTASPVLYASLGQVNTDSLVERMIAQDILYWVGLIAVLTPPPVVTE